MVHWPDIDTVLLDMDGTLLDLHFDNHFWLEHLPLRYAEHKGCEFSEAHRYLMQLSERLHGSLDWYCLDYWSDAIGMDIRALKEEVQHLIQLRPGTAAFLQFLRAQGKQMVIVTNAHPKALSLKLAASGLDREIEWQISAHQFKLAKENTGFWARLQEHAGFDYQRSLFIDDNLNVLRCARAEGLPHTVQVLHPDSSRVPNPLSEFPGVLQLDELIPA
jgi:HAD superfamily hydrolase (TIGR01509 family)